MAHSIAQIATRYNTEFVLACRRLDDQIHEIKGRYKNCLSEDIINRIYILACHKNSELNLNEVIEEQRVLRAMASLYKELLGPVNAQLDILRRRDEVFSQYNKELFKFITTI